MLTRRTLLGTPLAAVAAAIPERLVVLTMDDAVKSHRTFAGPLLKDLGFRATFFVTHSWMPDTERFMSWADIAELHRMGFEIGNHSWTHADFAQPLNAARLAGELALVENELARVRVPKPVSFGWCGNSFGPEAVAVVKKAGIRFARRGEMPEAPYGQLVTGATFDPARHHRLLIPTTGDAYPNWTFEHFQEVVAHAARSRIVVLQFHGTPDIAHPWVHTPPENFERYVRYLKEHDFRVVALQDLEPYIGNIEPADPLLSQRLPTHEKDLRLPSEMQATRADLGYWLPNMLRDHRYTAAEAALVTGLRETELKAPQAPAAPARICPYPGGRPLRLGFLEGAIDPLRGTKATVFLPWDPASYVVVDLPEAIFSNLGLLFLAHTHVPTIWNDKNIVIDNTDWTSDGEHLSSRWALPNDVTFGAVVESVEDRIEMELWLTNGTREALSSLRTQICVLLKGAAGFNAQTNDNKEFGKAIASVISDTGGLRILTEWERCGRTWGNAKCPCFHSDPVLPDCLPGETVRVRGKLWFA